MPPSSAPSSAPSSLPRLLTIMGSGETAPTMVKVHRALLERLGPPPVPAVLLDTPFGFQENASEVAARVVHYFAESLRAPIEVASLPAARPLSGRDEAGDRGPSGEAAPDRFAAERMVAAVRAARYVFTGPGSPTYALRKWRGTVIPSLLAEKLRHGGALTFSSAAALTLGVRTVPVYEIYKVGEDPFWEEGLDLLAEAGLNAAVIPHFNNAEGGTHDTRYCYLGERRLARMERELPEGAFVLGVDEHTALTLDLDAGSASISGLGVVTVRASGRSRVFEPGELRLSDLLEAAEALVRGRELAAGVSAETSARSAAGSGAAAEGVSAETSARSAAGSGAAAVGTAAGGGADSVDSVGGVGADGGALPGSEPEPRPSFGSYADSPLTGLVREQEGAFAAALERSDVHSAVAAVLELEDQIQQWSLDIPAGDALDRARASLRSLVLELGRVGETGARDPREVIGPYVEAMLELRAKARAERRFDEADEIRNRLAKLSVEVRDGPDGSEWVIAG